jgi:hypothetical protein
MTCKKYVDTLLVAEVETNSTRGFVGLATKGGTEFNQEGVNIVRTDASKEVQELIASAQLELLGRRVLVCRKHEETASGDKVHVLIVLKDVGVGKMAQKD